MINHSLFGITYTTEIEHLYLLNIFQGIHLLRKIPMFVNFSCSFCWRQYYIIAAPGDLIRKFQSLYLSPF